MTVTLVALDGSLWECDIRFPDARSPRVIVFGHQAFVQRGDDLVYVEQHAETVYQISKPKELGE